MSLTNCELLIRPKPADTVVLADATAETCWALADAAAYRRQTLSLGALHVDGALAPCALGELIDHLPPAPGAAILAHASSARERR